MLRDAYHWPPAAVEAVGERYLYRESRCTPNPPVHDFCGGPCRGGFQWDRRRWRERVAWMRSRGFDPARLDSQVHAAVAEFIERWPRRSREFLAARDPRTALAIFDATFGNGGRD